MVFQVHSELLRGLQRAFQASLAITIPDFSTANEGEAIL